MVVECENCNKVLERHIFCSNRCCVAFRRKGSVIKDDKKVKSVIVNDKKFIHKPSDVPVRSGSCKHGSALGLCKLGCSS